MLTLTTVAPKNFLALPPSSFGKFMSDPISEKIQRLALFCFKSMTNLFLGICGASEVAQLIRKTPSTPKMGLVRKRSFSPPDAYLTIHGGLMIGSGSLSLFAVLNEFRILNLHTMGSFVAAGGNFLFLGANIFALEENLRLFQELNKKDWKQPTIETTELNGMKRSAFWGILSNLGYILATTALLFNIATGIAIVIIILSGLAGGIKILYDLFLWGKSQNLL